MRTSFSCFLDLLHNLLLPQHALDSSVLEILSYSWLQNKFLGIGLEMKRIFFQLSSHLM